MMQNASVSSSHSGLFEKLAKKENGDIVKYDGFYLRILDNDKKEGSTKPQTSLTALVTTCDYVTLGEFRFTNSRKYEGLCFFTFDNKALYTVGSVNISTGEKRNYTEYLPYITDTLGLVWNNYTQIDLALDIDRSPMTVIYSLMKNRQDYDMIVNGKKVQDGERIRGFGEWFERTRARRDKYPTLYFKHKQKTRKKNSDFYLRIYDKRKEIEEESQRKTYIQDWNDYHGTFFRLEVTLLNEGFNDWLNFIRDTAKSGMLEEWGERERQEYLLEMQEYKMRLWLFAANKLVYFRNRHTREKITLFDIVTGNV